MLDKKEFYIGEEIRIHLKIDNSKCRKEVKNIKVRLLRRYHAHA